MAHLIYKTNTDADDKCLTENDTACMALTACYKIYNHHITNRARMTWHNCHSDYILRSVRSCY